MSADLELWLLVAACGAATYAWRGAGVLLSGGIDPNSRLFSWLGSVAYATLAALIARIMILPVGILEETQTIDRLLAAAIALAVFFATRKNLFAGVVAGGLTVVALTWLFPAG